jgi:type VI secretion system secreted protein VgrG
MDTFAGKSRGPITMDLPAAGQSLQFRSMVASEELGRDFTYELELISDDSGLRPDDLLGKGMTVNLELRDGGLRHFNGHISDFSLVGSVGEFVAYSVVLRPWLWLLTQTASCRIFQHLSVPEMVRNICREHGFTDIEDRLSASYPQHDFTVQYRETDFNFISRLLEREGIYYYFKHTKDKHVLVLTDSYGGHDVLTGCERLPYYPPDAQRRAGLEYVDSWQTKHRVEAGSYSLTDFDFERPTADLLTKFSAPHAHAHATFEVFDYPGPYTQRKQGEDYTRVRLEERHATRSVALGSTNARSIAVGNFFALYEHPLGAQNREYLIVSARHALRTHDPRSGAEFEESEVHRCQFSVIESSRPFRSARLARTPAVLGPQTAVVVGKAGEEIWTDHHGRIKVKFHWDRASANDETSSCWVRVSQNWAGSGWGSMHIPRIGQEVIVDFLEGDPDRPIVTGRVYNGDNPVPFALPANQTQSGVKSRSTKEGGPDHFNAIRFDDKKGVEQVYLQAERDLHVFAKNDESREVGRDQNVVIGHDRIQTVRNNETLAIEGSRSETVTNQQTTAIGAARATTVGTADSLTVDGIQTITVGGARSISVGGIETTLVEGSRSIDVGGNQSISISGSRSEQVAKGENVSIRGERSQSVRKDDVLDVGGKLTINVADEIVLKTGSAILTMKSSGVITIQGKSIELDGSSKVAVKGSKVTQN